MKSFTNLKTIDDIMYIVDGIKGNGGLGYKPYYMHGGGYLSDIDNKIKELEPVVKSTGKYKKELSELFRIKYGTIKRMKGGMAFVDINNPDEITDEHLKQYGLNNYEEYLKVIMNANSDEKLKTIKLLEQLKDLEQIKEDNDRRDNDKNDTIDKLVDDYKDIISGYLDKDISNKILKSKKFKEKIPDDNTLYRENETLAKNTNVKNINQERGEIFEDDVTNYDIDTGILKNLDNDPSTSYNSKDYDQYNPEFINKIIEKYDIKDNGKYKTINNLTNDEKILIEEKILTYIPIDIIKDNTIWELKSFSKDIYNKKQNIKGNHQVNAFQVMGNSKMNNSRLYDKQNKKIDYDINFRYIKDGNNWKVKNLYTNIDGKEIPILKKDNYDYYWMWSNPDNIGYYNPLKNKKFTPIKVKKNNYKFGWDDETDPDDLKKIDIVIPNSEINIYPTRYSEKFKNIIKKYK